MSDRRFTDKPELNPGAVRELPPDHPALRENRTLFPSTVVTVTKDTPEHLLVSGHSNKKLGKEIAKGRFAGYALYQLSLEERATCPIDCSVRAVCYGSSMQWARRHRIGDADVFFDRLGMEVFELLDKHPSGVMVRLHVLGDFPSVEYVNFWGELLDENEKLACYGYTHRRPTWNQVHPGGDEIGDAIAKLKSRHPERFRIRWSDAEAQPDGAVVIDHVPASNKTEDGFVCPAQTDDTASCSTCGLCWETAFVKQTILFVKHGPKSVNLAAEAVMKSMPVNADGIRPIVPIVLPKTMQPNAIPTGLPEIRNVAPRSLLVESKYQRDLSGKSLKLIRHVASNWDWRKFKPPIVAESDAGLFVIDGQHTAIAAATHPSIKEIPVLVVPAGEIEKRAEAFVAHNRDRVAMSVLQVFHAEVAAAAPEARAIMALATEAGLTIPRYIPPRGKHGPHDFIAIERCRRVFRGEDGGPARMKRIFAIAALSKVSPVQSTVVEALTMLLSQPIFAETAALTNDEIAAGLASIPAIEQTALKAAGQTGQSRVRAAAMLISRAALAGRIAA